MVDNYFLVRSYRKFSRGSNEKAGRTVYGSVTVFSKKSRVKRLYRVVDYNRVLCSRGRLIKIYRDSFRTGFLGQVFFVLGIMSLILVSEQAKVGDWMWNRWVKHELEEGYVTFLGKYILGTLIYHVELYPGGGAKLARAAGCSAFVYNKFKDVVILKMRSGVLLKLSRFCSGVLGVVSNKKHWKFIIGKAGLNSKLGRKPIVRGVAMNPVDHPHGGGEGKKTPKFHRTPWGMLTKGLKTRRKKKLAKL